MYLVICRPMKRHSEDKTFPHIDRNRGEAKCVFVYVKKTVFIRINFSLPSKLYDQLWWLQINDFH